MRIFRHGIIKVEKMFISELTIKSHPLSDLGFK